MQGRPLENLSTSSLLQHFSDLIGPYGFYQHAAIKQPLLQEGYCVDDNARAVQFLVYLQKHLLQPSAVVEDYLQLCWQYLVDARISPGVYHNFRSATGEWLPHDVSEDMYARLLRAYAMVLRYDTNQTRRTQAQELLSEVLEHQCPHFTYVRSWAELPVALADIPEAERRSWPIQSLVQQAVDHLQKLWVDTATDDWSWFEPTMTYANALMPHGLMKAQQLGAIVDEQMFQSSLDFLLATTIVNDMFQPVGNYGWYPKGGQKTMYDQQPIEAGTMFDGLLDYYAQAPEKIRLAQVVAPYRWFFGHNTRGVAMVDMQDHSCMDGLLETGYNRNCGGESLLAYLWSEIRLRTAPQPIRDYIKKVPEGT